MAVRASRAEAEARAVNDFLRNDVLAQASASTQARPERSPTRTSRYAPHSTARQHESRGSFPDQPLVEASIRQTIGETYLDLGLYPEAQLQLERVLELRCLGLLGDDHLDTLTVAATLGMFTCTQVNTIGWSSTYGESIRSESSILGEEHRLTLRIMSDLARELFSRKGKYSEAQSVFTRCS